MCVLTDKLTVSAPGAGSAHWTRSQIENDQLTGSCGQSNGLSLPAELAAHPVEAPGAWSRAAVTAADEKHLAIGGNHAAPSIGTGLALVF